jgi:hypothetical protein
MLNSWIAPFLHGDVASRIFDHYLGPPTRDYAAETLAALHRPDPPALSGAAHASHGPHNGRGERIRTSGPCLPKTVLYQAELLPDRCARPWRAGGAGCL